MGRKARSGRCRSPKPGLWRTLAIAGAALAAATATLIATQIPLSSTGAATTLSSDYGTGRWMAADPNGGYWLTNFFGAVTPHDGAPQFGSPTASGLHLSQPVMGIAPNPDGFGYWLVASDGGIFSYGDAQFYGSTGSIHLNQPVVGMAPTPDGHGYWLVASDGGIFSYGDAQFYGSTGSIRLNQPIEGMAPTPDGGGYWLVASDGGVFTFGDAPFDGSLGGTGASVLGMVVTPFTGYSIIVSDGGARAFLNTAGQASTMTTGPAQADIVGGPPAGDCAPTTNVGAAPDTEFDNLFSSQSGPGWVGGDATYSTRLPSGQEAFDFSDTLVGTAQPTGSATILGMPSNSELVGAVPDLYSVFGGTFGAPASLIPDSGGNSWQVAATYMENGNQLVFVNEFAPRPGSTFDNFTGRSGIASFSMALGRPTLESLTMLPTDSTTQWGNAAMQDGSYDYVYGLDFNTSTSVFYGMKMARVPLGESVNPSDWTYWNGSQWVAGEANAAVIATPALFTGVIALAHDSGYMAVSIPNGFASNATVDLSFSCSPTGPWSSLRPIYTIPQVSQYPDELAYIPTFHADLSGGGNLVVSYNIDTTDGLSALANDVRAYQPHFLVISG